MESMIFDGFSRETLAFLSELAANNNREWFAAHKDIYTHVLLPEAQALVSAVGQRLRESAPELRYDTRTNGQGSLLRIYRDLRFSRDKTPYNARIRMVWWQGEGKKTANPAFFLNIEPEGGSIFVGEWQFSREVLAAYRDAVAGDELGPALVEAMQAVRDAGDYEVGGEHYKRVPRGYDTEHPRAELLRYNGLWAHDSRITPALPMSAELVDVCAERCRDMAPIFDWLVRLHARV